MSDREAFEAWWAKNHPFDWWASELKGTPVSTKVRLLVHMQCAKAWQAALAAQQKANDIHTCSYYCTRPACIRAQRDELRDRLEAQQKSEPVLWVERRTKDGAFESAPDVRESRPDIDPGEGWEWIALYAAPPLDAEGIRLLREANKENLSQPLHREIEAYLAKYPGA